MNKKYNVGDKVILRKTKQNIEKVKDFKKFENDNVKSMFDGYCTIQDVVFEYVGLDDYYWIKKEYYSLLEDTSCSHWYEEDFMSITEFKINKLLEKYL